MVQEKKLTDQIALSTESQTFNMLRAYTDWKKDKDESKETLDIMEEGLGSINASSKLEDIEITFYTIQKTIENLDLALEGHGEILVKWFNEELVDYSHYVEGSGFKRISPEMKRDGKLNLIAVFKIIYTDLKITDSKLHARIKTAFYKTFMQIMSDVREIYDAGLGREVRKPGNLKKFKERQDLGETAEPGDEED